MKKPAIEGGNPIRKEYLIFGKPDIGKEEINEVVNTLKSGWLSTGPKVKRLEDRFKKYVGCKHAIAVNSCTAALHLSLLCNGVGKDDEVIVTPMTFAATVNVIEHVGAKPVFVDIEKDSYNIDADKIKKAITSKTKAIILVHFAGLPCDMLKVNKIAREHKLIVIEDAAHAIGSEYNSKKIGSEGNPTCFSFYATKNLTAGEGGMIALNDGKLAEKMRIYSLHGLSKHAWQRYTKDCKKTYEIVYPGYKYNMQDINAAIAIHQLEKIDKFNSIRKKYAKLYFKAFKNYDLIELPPDKKERKNAWHLFPILLKLDKLKISRNDFINALDKENIGSGIHFLSIHEQPYYKKKYKLKKNILKRAEYVSSRTASLPLQTSMNKKDVLDVVKAVKRILDYYKI
ncbi:hypothetical protein CEE44_02225 [Candidatus Woesearchaeota archaeon B3_Woes]|nr:MAG: hypothetical protein CEE44_02225 [Candidatus Woesearchaeota archaeon B3_Woes]